MNKSKRLVFGQNARLTLEGEAPLLPVQWSSPAKVVYRVGDRASGIRLIDCRAASNQAAMRALQAGGALQFNGEFHRPAYVTIYSNGLETDIHVDEATEEAEEMPVILVGSSEIHIQRK